MKNGNTRALSLVKQRLLNGEHIDQPSMLEQTDGVAWRLSAAIYSLGKEGWNIARYDLPSKVRVYYLPHAEIQRIKAEGLQ